MSTSVTLINSQEHQSHLRERTIASALAILDSELKTLEPVGHSERVKHYLRLHLQPLERECFAVLYLNAQYRLIKYEPLFFGSVSSTKVEIREVARRALMNNASAIILAHNHPSGDSTFSEADKSITKVIAKSLEIFEIAVLDHLLAAGGDVVSMAEQDLL